MEQEANLEVAVKVPVEKKPRKKRKARVQIGKFPAVPIRGLWSQASEEEKAQAQQRAQVIMNYWMGQLSKMDACRELLVKPVRFWQLTDQAVKGMAVGLLWQPRSRGKKVRLSAERLEVEALRKKIANFERSLRAQQKLIEVLKSMPGIQRRAGIDGDTARQRVHGAGEKPRDRALTERTARQPEAGSGSARS